ncbi:MAG: hypothetical protein R3D67_00590 [Hyphomicrobiaceae bacterium]
MLFGDPAHRIGPAALLGKALDFRSLALLFRNTARRIGPAALLGKALGFRSLALLFRNTARRIGPAALLGKALGFRSPPLLFRNPSLLVVGLAWRDRTFAATLRGAPPRFGFCPCPFEHVDLVEQALVFRRGNGNTLGSANSVAGGFR